MGQPRYFCQTASQRDLQPPLTLLRFPCADINRPSTPKSSTNHNDHQVGAANAASAASAAVCFCAANCGCQYQPQPSFRCPLNLNGAALRLPAATLLKPPSPLLRRPPTALSVPACSDVPAFVGPFDRCLSASLARGRSKKRHGHRHAAPGERPAGPPAPPRPRHRVSVVPGCAGCPPPLQLHPPSRCCVEHAQPAPGPTLLLPPPTLLTLLPGALPSLPPPPRRS